MKEFVVIYCAGHPLISEKEVDYTFDQHINDNYHPPISWHSYAASMNTRFLIYGKENWEISEDAYNYFKSAGYKIVLHPDDKRENFYKYNISLDKYIGGYFKIHGHYWDVCNNGILGCSENFFYLPKDAEYKFLSEEQNGS